MTDPSSGASPGRPLRPPRRPLTELAEWLAAADPTTLVQGPLVGTATGVALASQRVLPGDIYAAMPGSRAHGIAFAGDAVTAGAVAVLTDAEGAARAPHGVPVLWVASPRTLLGRFAAHLYGEPARSLRMLGVTGTQGKTTSTRLAESALQGAGEAAVVGTVGTRVDGEEIKTALTTPEAPDLHALFAMMKERSVDTCAMEVSSHALVQGRVDGVRFDVAVFTNLGRDHLDFHADLEDYFQAKASLFTAGRSAQGLVNADDVHGRRLLAEAGGVPLQSYSAAGGRADWRAEHVEITAAGSRFVVAGPDGIRVEASCPLPGDFNVANALAALAGCALLGHDLEPVAEAMAQGGGVPGRLERVDVGQDFTVVVDYAHKPDAVTAALAALRPLTEGRLIVVLGAGGERDHGKRPIMGEIAARMADVLVVTDDNPRGEEPASIRAEILAGSRGGTAEVVEVDDRRAAIRAALALAASGDVVLVAGKGHETGQEVAGVVLPFDDREVVREDGGALVIAMTLAEIAEAVGGEVAGDAGSHEVTVTGAAFRDNREPVAGGLFVAIAGERVDGHDFAEHAVAAGAAAVLGSRPTAAPTVVVADVVVALGRLARHVVDVVRPTVLALTGSQGKTGTKDYLAHVLAGVGKTVATAGNLNNELGVPLTVLRCTPDTDYLVVEMGARGVGHIAELCRIAPPDVAAVLNVGTAHLGEFGSQEAIAQAKGEIIEALGPEGTAVLNADDPWTAVLRERTAARVLTFGSGLEPDVHWHAARLDDLGRPEFVLGAGGGSHLVRLTQYGTHQVGNATAAAAMAVAAGVNLGHCAQALASATTTSPWRMEVHERADGLVVINDAYNANPASMVAAVDAMISIAARREKLRKVAVLGVMLELGAAHEEEHERIGRLAAERGVDVIVAVGEQAAGIARGARAVPQWQGVTVTPVGRDDALAWVRKNVAAADATPGSWVVLVKASRGAALESVAEGLLDVEEGSR